MWTLEFKNSKALRVDFLIQEFLLGIIHINDGQNTIQEMFFQILHFLPAYQNNRIF